MLSLLGQCMPFPAVVCHSLSLAENLSFGTVLAQKSIRAVALGNFHFKFTSRKDSARMTTTERTHPKVDQREKDTIKVIDLLVQEIQNSLQVMRMEAELRLMEQGSTRGLQGAFDAGQNIERLFRELRLCFCSLQGDSPINQAAGREDSQSISWRRSKSKTKLVQIH